MSNGHRGKRPSHQICGVCGKTFATAELVPAELVRTSVQALITASHPVWNGASFICHHDLNMFRTMQVRTILERERGALSSLDVEVMRSLQAGETVAQNVGARFDHGRSIGEKVADRVATFGGSWTFLILFFVALVFWMASNSSLMPWHSVDPYPFIFLNLMLSCLAAVQAPVILMSQNRQTARDRLAMEDDYRTNLKAEIEIRNLTAKIDQLMAHQWQRLLEIQELQIEMLSENQR